MESQGGGEAERRGGSWSSSGTQRRQRPEIFICAGEAAKQALVWKSITPTGSPYVE